MLPLDDRTLERLNAAMVGRPDLMAGRTSLTVHEGMLGMSENVFINTGVYNVQASQPTHGTKGLVTPVRSPLNPQRHELELRQRNGFRRG